MKSTELKLIDGKKIRRQYFNIPLVVLYYLAFLIPYFILAISFFTKNFDADAWPYTLWISIWICFCFSIPFLILKTLNKHFFGKIICVFSNEGIHYPKGKLFWNTIEKIEYALNSDKRYKSDTEKPYRAIVYTSGGRHVVLNNSPIHLLHYAKKYKKDIDIKITGAKSLIANVLIITSLFLICPLYVALLVNSPAASMPLHYNTLAIIIVAISFIFLSIISSHIFDIYNIQYRFWRKILPHKWLSYIILGFYYTSFFTAILVFCYFPKAIVASIVVLYLAIVNPPYTSRYGHRRKTPSYRELCEIYINNAEHWEKKINTQKEKKQGKRK